MSETYCFENFQISKHFWITNTYNKDDPSKTRSHSKMWADFTEEQIEQRIEELGVILRGFRDKQVEQRNSELVPKGED